MKHLNDAASTATGQTAVLYLRVSTRDQAKRGGEVEGFSIPAQREACQKYCQSLGIEVIEEFVDAGESARSANRPELQRMLAFVKAHRVDYAIVHRIDRLSRNRIDDVEINVALQNSGVTLVSCTENIDETPSGKLMHGMLSSLSEYYSANLANEAKKGMRQKAKNGGTPGAAPFGYINVCKRTEEGYEMRTVEVDPERAEWVPWLFERYATGEWTVNMLQEELEEKGVKTRPRPGRKPRPLARSHISNILLNRYYTGVVTFEGVEYPGRHDPLITEALFDKCQRVRQARSQSREKPRIRTQYLKGSVFCGECGSPLTLEVSRNRTGTYYEYFYCLGRQSSKNGCTFVATQVAIVEDLVEEHWRTVQLGDEAVRHIRELVWQYIEEVLPERATERAHATATLVRLKAESDKLLQAYYADALDLTGLKAEQRRITAERAAAEQTLIENDVAGEHIRSALERCCALLNSAYDQYLTCDNNGRRDLNQAVFEKLYITDNEIVASNMTPVFQHLLDDNLETTLETESLRPKDNTISTSDPEAIEQPTNSPLKNLHSNTAKSVAKKRTKCPLGSYLKRERPFGLLPWEQNDPRYTEVCGSNVDVLVGVAGIEPATNRL